MIKKVDILGTRYKIIESTYGEMYDAFGDSVRGMIDYKNKVIRYHKDDAVATLLHEYLHGLFYEAGFSVENEENLIEFMCAHINKIITFYASTLPLEDDKDDAVGQESVPNTTKGSK